MSDDPGTSHWNTNAGWTLPSDSKATHDIGLSPLFLARNGYGGNIEQGQNAILEQGSQGYRWTNISRKDSLGYYQGSNDTQSLPIEYGNRAYPFSLRCLVSTNNRIIINDLRWFSESKAQKRLIKANSVLLQFSCNLVSDSLEDKQYPNAGSSLPSREGATNNIGLTPLFHTRSGHMPNTVSSERGRAGIYWSSISSSVPGSYYDQSDIDAVYPSNTFYGARVRADTLRCLVSTNNRSYNK